MILETGAFLGLFQGLKNGISKYTEKPCGRVSGGVAEQGGGLRAEGTILGVGGDGVVSEHGVLWEYRWGGVVGASGWKKFGKTDHAGWAEVELRG